MKLQNRFPINLDSVAGLVTGTLLLLIMLAVWLGDQAGIRVTSQLPANSIVGPLETLTLTFSEPVDGDLAIQSFSIQPPVNGSFTFPDSKTLQFIPREAFQPNTPYTLTLASGVLAQNNRSLKKTMIWGFHVRSPLVVYLVAEQGKGRLWTVEPASGTIKPLTDASLSIFGFDTSHNGEFVIFSAFNEQKGSDLWRVEREGGNPVLLLQCGADRCSVPAISFYDRQVAYVRETAGPAADLEFGAPRIWVLDLETKQDSPLYEDRQIIGYNPVWSPDGTRLSSFDGIKDEIRLLDIVTGNQLIIPSQTGSPVSWSRDSNTFLFTDIAESEAGSFTQIREAKLVTSEITTFSGESDKQDYHYNSLAWSPTADMLVIGLQFEENDPSQALWLVDIATLGGQVIANQANYTYGTPQWDPWGKALVFQQFKLKGVYKPEIGFWEEGLLEPRILAEGLMPHWLP
ncbi:MAG: Ig-like domain-containing protein [Anaerolineales bacterium]|nr:Ig-like domain-containing protein [Anaerolineales bacterium]